MGREGLSNFLRGRTGIIVMAVAFLLLIVGVWGLRSWYNNNLQPVSDSKETVYFTVERGDSRNRIANKLEHAELIRSAAAFNNYIRTKEINNLQAGTYVLSPSMSVPEIVAKMVRGDVARNLLTILPGKTLSQIKQAFVAEGYSRAEVEKAFSADQYRDHPALISLPMGASLEGYLYPDSFQKEADTPAEDIVRKSLDEMREHLSVEVINGFAAQGLSIYQGITLSSIVLAETDNPKYQSMVAQVFYKRLKIGMKLESDATTRQFNTYEKKGLPPKPLSNVTVSALQATAQPAKTDYLFFVAGDDDQVHFSKTKEAHEEAVRQYCRQKCTYTPL